MKPALRSRQRCPDQTAPKTVIWWLRGSAYQVDLMRMRQALSAKQGEGRQGVARLAAGLGISTPYAEKILSGRQPSLELIFRLQDELGLLFSGLARPVDDDGRPLPTDLAMRQATHRWLDGLVAEAGR